MKFIYCIEDLNKLRISEDVKMHVEEELRSICSSVDSIRNLKNFNLFKFGVILVIDNYKELDELLYKKNINKYGDIMIKFVEERILENKKILIIKFINREEKLIECVIDNKTIMKVEYYNKKLIEQNIKVIKKYNKSKLIL